MKKMIIQEFHNPSAKMVYDYSDEKRNDLIDQLLAADKDVMLRKIDDTLVILVDTAAFKQR